MGKLVHTQLSALVGDIEQISHQAQPFPFRNADGVIQMGIDGTVIQRTAQGATRGSAVGGVVGAERYFTSVMVARVRKQVVDRNPRLEVHGRTDSEALRVVSTQGIAYEAIRQVVNVCVQDTRDKLLSKEIEVATGEIEERADVRIVLAVVIAERTLVVAN